MHPRLKAYIPMADMLAATFGDECEVVLHDIADPEHSVVYVANGTVTGREIGQGFEHFVKNTIEHGASSEYAVNDFFHKKGKLISTSSVLIRDDDGRLLGALCINLDMTRTQQQIDYLKAFMPQPKPEPVRENQGQRVEEMVLSLIDNILAGVDVTALSREERIEKIRFMETRGIFQLKGSIDQVAERLGVNRVTVYSYLDEVRGKR